jgi:hypothetical protein
MTEKLNGQSAKIYEFPRGGRASLHGHRLVKTAAAIIPANRRVSRIEFGSCWYHETAIQDVEGMRRR